MCTIVHCKLTHTPFTKVLIELKGPNTRFSTEGVTCSPIRSGGVTQPPQAENICKQSTKEKYLAEPIFIKRHFLKVCKVSG